MQLIQNYYGWSAVPGLAGAWKQASWGGQLKHTAKACGHPKDVQVSQGAQLHRNAKKITCLSSLITAVEEMDYVKEK